jgi:hypothetical protein
MGRYLCHKCQRQQRCHHHSTELKLLYSHSGCKGSQIPLNMTLLLLKILLF